MSKQKTAIGGRVRHYSTLPKQEIAEQKEQWMDWENLWLKEHPGCTAKDFRAATREQWMAWQRKKGQEDAKA